MTIAVIRNTATDLIITGAGPEIMALFRTRATVQAGIDAAERALAKAQERLRTAQQPPPALDMTNSIDRAIANFWTPERRLERLELAQAGVRRCEYALARGRAELAALDAEDRAAELASTLLAAE